MSFTHTVTEALTAGTGIKQTQQTFTVNAEVDVDLPVTHSTTNTQHLISFPTQGGKLKTLYIVSDQTITLYTNHASGSSPDNTIALTAGVPVMWNVNSGYTCPVGAADVASIYVTHGGSIDATLTIRADYNP